MTPTQDFPKHLHHETVLSWTCGGPGPWNGAIFQGGRQQSKNSNPSKILNFDCHLYGDITWRQYSYDPGTLNIHFKTVGNGLSTHFSCKDLVHHPIENNWNNHLQNWLLLRYQDCQHLQTAKSEHHFFPSSQPPPAKPQTEMPRSRCAAVALRNAT